MRNFKILSAVLMFSDPITKVGGYFLKNKKFSADGPHCVPINKVKGTFRILFLTRHSKSFSYQWEIEFFKISFGTSSELEPL